jgi:fumarate hydratase class II
MGQSSNDVFPSAVHLAALDQATNELLPALRRLERSLSRKAKQFEDVVKAGRTHLMDAVPVTLGQEFAATPRRSALGRSASRPRSSTSARSRSAAPRPAPA